MKPVRGPLVGIFLWLNWPLLPKSALNSAPLVVSSLFKTLLANLIMSNRDTVRYIIFMSSEVPIIPSTTGSVLVIPTTSHLIARLFLHQVDVARVCGYDLNQISLTSVYMAASQPRAFQKSYMARHDFLLR